MTRVVSAAPCVESRMRIGMARSLDTMSEFTPVSSVKHLRARFEGNGNPASASSEDAETEKPLSNKPERKPKPGHLSRGSSLANAPEVIPSVSEPTTIRIDDGLDASEHIENNPVNLTAHKADSTESTDDPRLLSQGCEATANNTSISEELPSDTTPAPRKNEDNPITNVNEVQEVTPELSASTPEASVVTVATSPTKSEPPPAMVSEHVSPAKSIDTGRPTPVSNAAIRSQVISNTSAPGAKPELPPRPVPNVPYKVRERPKAQGTAGRPAVPPRTYSKQATTVYGTPTGSASKPASSISSSNASQVPARYDQCFDIVSTDSAPPIVQCGTVYEVWMRSGLSVDELAVIWRSVAGDDPNKQGLLRAQFTTGLRLIDAELRRQYILRGTASSDQFSSVPALPARPAV